MARSGWPSGGIRRSVLAGSLAVLLFVLLGGSASPGATCSVTWHGHGGGASWSDSATWSTSSVPAASDHVCVDAQGGSLTIPVGVTPTVASLDVAEGLDLQSGALTVTGPDLSTVARLIISGGELGGAGAVSIT